MLGSFAASAQQDPMYTQYMFNQLPVNPAYAGSKDRLAALVLHRAQWVGFEGAPNTTSFTVHSPIAGSRSSFGVTVVHDQIGISNNIHLKGDYAYRIDFGNWRLAMGVSGEMKRQQMSWNRVNPLQPFDPNLPAGADNVSLPNFGGGIYIDTDRFYVGAAMPRLLENDLDYTSGIASVTSAARQRRHYYFMGGAIFDLSSNVKFKPAILTKFTDNAPVSIDINTSFLFSEKVWLGATFRNGDSIDLIAQMIFGDFRVGYAYDYTLTQLNAYNRGTHEILLEFNVQRKVKGIYHPRYF